MADFGRFKVGWYPYGDVLYVSVAEDDRSLEDAVERLPWSTVVVSRPHCRGRAPSATLASTRAATTARARIALPKAHTSSYRK